MGSSGSSRRTKVSLAPHLPAIRRWVREGRSDKWIAQELGASAAGVQSVRLRNGILRAVPAHFVDREQDVRRWVEEGRSDEWIAQQLGSDKAKVRDFRYRAGISRHPEGSPGRVKLKDHEQRIRRWVAEGKSDEWIAEQVGSSVGSLQSFRSRNGIYRRYPRDYLSADTVRRWVDEGRSDEWMGERSGRGTSGIRKFRSENGILRPKRGYAFEAIDRDLVEGWVREGRTTRWISEQLGIPAWAVSKYLGMEGISRDRALLREREDDIRRWVREGRSDEWIAAELGTSANSVAATRSLRRILRAPGAGRLGNSTADPDDSPAKVRRRNEVATLYGVGPRGVRGYDGLRERTGLSRNALREHLEELEERGLAIVLPRAAGERTAMEASLTEAGLALLEALEAGLELWGDRGTQG